MKRSPLASDKYIFKNNVLINEKTPKLRLVSAALKMLSAIREKNTKNSSMYMTNNNGFAKIFH